MLTSSRSHDCFSNTSETEGGHLSLGAQCQGKTKEGKPCKAPPTSGGLCYFHANPDQARILGQKGGRKKLYQVTDVVVPQNITMATLATVLDQVLGELLAGRMEPRVATAVGQLVNTRRRLTETVDLETRVAELERKLSEHDGVAAEQATAPPKEFEVPLWIEKEDELVASAESDDGKA
jgi:hypothetical protein